MAAMNKKLSAAELKKAADQSKRVSVGKAAGKTAKPVVKTTPGKAGPASKGGSSIASKIAKRVGTTAREARDVVTAVGSAAQAVRKSPQRGINAKKIVSDVGTQIKEVATAAKTGKKGTTAFTVKPNKESASMRRANNGGYVKYNVNKKKER